MPEDTPPEWQAAEYAKARLDLQLEVLKGASLNDIRRKYNQDTVEGDDEPMNVGDANLHRHVQRRAHGDETHAARGLRAHD